MTYRYIGQTFESGESADGEPQSASEKIKRAIEGAVDDAKDIASGGMGNIGSGGDISGALDDRFGSENTVYRPDDGGLYDSTSLGDSLKSSLKEQTKQFSEFFKTALFGKDGYDNFHISTVPITVAKHLHIAILHFCKFRVMAFSILLLKILRSLNYSN